MNNKDYEFEELGLFLATPMGMYVAVMAELTLKLAKENPKIDGFIFNGVVVSVDLETDTVETIKNKYDKAFGKLVLRNEQKST